MNNKMIGALLLTASGLITTLGLVGAQIANAIVLSGFFTGDMTYENPPGPQAANLPGLVLVAVIILAALGLFYLLQPAKCTAK